VRMHCHYHMLSNMQGAMSNAVVRDPKERAQAHSAHSNSPLSGIFVTAE